MFTHPKRNQSQKNSLLVAALLLSACSLSGRKSETPPVRNSPEISEAMPGLEHIVGLKPDRRVDGVALVRLRAPESETAETEKESSSLVTFQAEPAGGVSHTIERSNLPAYVRSFIRVGEGELIAEVDYDELTYFPKTGDSVELMPSIQGGLPIGTRILNTAWDASSSDDIRVAVNAIYEIEERRGQRADYLCEGGAERDFRCNRASWTSGDEASVFELAIVRGQTLVLNQGALHAQNPIDGSWRTLEGSYIEMSSMDMDVLRLKRSGYPWPVRYVDTSLLSDGVLNDISATYGNIGRRVNAQWTVETDSHSESGWGGSSTVKWLQFWFSTQLGNSTVELGHKTFLGNVYDVAAVVLPNGDLFVFMVRPYLIRRPSA